MKSNANNHTTTVQLISHEFNSVKISQCKSDGYLNATAMCKACCKRSQHYLENKTTKKFLEELASVTGIPVTDLVRIIQGGIPSLQGTWVHPKVAIHLAQWLGTKVFVQVSEWMYDWMMTGQNSLTAPNPALIDRVTVLEQTVLKLCAAQSASPSRPELPIRVFTYPTGALVRVFFLKKKLLVRAEDVLRILDPDVDTGNYAKCLEDMGLSRHFDFDIYSLRDFELAYLVRPMTIRRVAQLSPEAGSPMTFLFEQGIYEFRAEYPEFYQWYWQTIRPLHTTLEHILKAIG